MKNKSLEEYFRILIANRVFRFLVIGFINTLFHNGVYYFLMNYNSWSSTTNNVIAFSLSVQVAYLGHRFITFSNPGNIKTAASFTKFLTQAGVNLGLSSLFSLIVIDYLGYIYYYQILFNVAVLPFVSFTMMKFWVFKSN